MSTQEMLKGQDGIHTMTIVKEVEIAAAPEIVFETILEPVGQMKEMGMKIEPWVGGRWFRDLGNNTGHLWVHVQVIKPPKLLELYGPMAMSYAAVSHVQYRLIPEGKGTRLVLTHQAMGVLTQDHREGMPKGWGQIVGAIKEAAEGRGRK